MKFLRYGVFAALAGLIVVATPIDAAVAQSAAKIIKQRQAVMKEFSSHMKAVKKYVKGPSKKLTGKKLKRAIKKAGNNVDMELRAQAIGGQAARLMRFFPKGTSKTDGVGKTRAKPVIWTDWAGFEGAAATLGRLAGALETAAAGGDKAKMGAALKALGKKGCGGCHKNFRGKKQKKKGSS